MRRGHDSGSSQSAERRAGQRAAAPALPRHPRDHARHGQDWLKALFPDLPKSEIIARTQREVEQWKEWIAEKHRTGQHGCDVFLPRVEAKCARMPPLPNPQHFQPLGSSAATTSYGLNG